MRKATNTEDLAREANRPTTQVLEFILSAEEARDLVGVMELPDLLADALDEAQGAVHSDQTSAFYIVIKVQP